MRIVSVKQMVELEMQANETGLTYEIMLANAGFGLAKTVYERFSNGKRKTVVGLIGGGNNGGDTLIALTHLARLGWAAKAYLVKSRDPNEQIVIGFEKEGGFISDASHDFGLKVLGEWIQKADIILDGILGTGIKLPLKKEVLDVMAFVGTMIPKTALMVAVDCPSGIDCDSGEAACECLTANLTVCMAAVKQGLLKFPAFNFVGELACVDIGLPNSLPGWQKINGEVIDFEQVISLMPDRKKDGHKGTFGTCMIIAGSERYCGAVILACEAAYRMGAGLVQAAIPDCIYSALAGNIPEAIWLPLPSNDGTIDKHGHTRILENLERVSVMLIGPGMGLNEHTRIFLENLLHSQTLDQTKKNNFEDRPEEMNNKTSRHQLQKMVIDADGLKILANIEGWIEIVPPGSVFTPHPGEMSVLMQKPISSIQSDRIESAIELAKQSGQCVVLKGALTVVARPEGNFAVIPIATSALATAGTGDVLAGMIAALMAQGMESYDAATASAWVHAQAGLLAADFFGSTYPVMARDIIRFIPEALIKEYRQLSMPGSF